MNISKHTGILVIGSSLSGAIAAIYSAEEGKNVLIIMNIVDKQKTFYIIINRSKMTPKKFWLK